MIKDISFVLVFISLIVFVHSRVVIEGNTTKSLAQKSSSCYCSGINQVCIDNLCYCAPNYQKNAYGSCLYQSCTWDSDCSHTQDLHRSCKMSSCVCDSGYFEDPDNGRKCTAQSQTTTNCDDCLSSDNKVCVDDQCYCQANYKKQFNSFNSWTCIYQGCSADSDCIKDQDLERHCSYGSCNCDSGYYEDWNNGRKCTYDNTYDTDLNYDTTDVWGWLWLVFVAPVALIFVFICVRHRRVHLAHPTSHPPPHFMEQSCPVEQPPPYEPPPYYFPKGQPPPPPAYDRY